MNVFRPEILELLAAVESKYGKELSTTTDFEEFSCYLSVHNYPNLSASTLKRLWGYVNYPHTPRIHTLDVLAKFIGFICFENYCVCLKATSVHNSSFFLSKKILASELNPLDSLEIGWSPNRYVRLSYKGHFLFEVVEAQNSKLCEGDCFEATVFMMGQPLSLPYIWRNGEKTQPFIAGRNGGLTLLNYISYAGK